MLIVLSLYWYVKIQWTLAKVDNDAIYCSVFEPQTIKNQIKVELVGDNFTELRGEIAGPPDTPYEGILPVSHLRHNDCEMSVACESFILFFQRWQISSWNKNSGNLSF